MKIAIVGSRTITDYKLIESTVLKYISLHSITCIVSGGAKGVDTLAEEFAKKHNLPMQIFLPDWNTYGKRAGFIRNADIVSAADYVFAFQANNSVGTEHSISLARKLKKHLTVTKLN